MWQYLTNRVGFGIIELLLLESRIFCYQIRNQIRRVTNFKKLQSEPKSKSKFNTRVFPISTSNSSFLA
jgi:hypothetical protein